MLTDVDASFCGDRVTMALLSPEWMLTEFLPLSILAGVMAVEISAAARATELL